MYVHLFQKDLIFLLMHIYAFKRLVYKLGAGDTLQKSFSSLYSQASDQVYYPPFPKMLIMPAL